MDFTDSDVLDRQYDANWDRDSDVFVGHIAAANGETDTLTQAIKQDPSVLEVRDNEGLTPLGHAVLAAQLDAVKLLVKMGASINAQDHLGRSCLAMAAYQGWYDGVVLLLRHGAKQSITDKAGRTALHAATYDTDTRTLGLLAQNLSADQINEPDHEGMTALHWAAFHNRPQHLQLLLMRGADITQQDIDGRTPLHWAAQNGSLACCSILCKYQQGELQVNARDQTGKTALHFAAAAGHSLVLKELAAVEGCDVEAEDPDDRTPLHWAAANGQVATVQVLLQLNADPKVVDMEGGTPLDYARQSGHKDCVRLLEQHLGIQGSPAKAQAGKDTDQVKAKTNPLGFIADFFRPRKKEVRDENSYAETFHESSGQEETTSELGDKQISPQPSLRSSPARKVSKEEILQSLEKLQLSREDNPVVSKQSRQHSLGDIKPSHSHNIPLAANKCVLPPPGVTAIAAADTRTDHKHLIRSPPPALKRDRSLSPSPARLSSMSPNESKSTSNIPDDVAEILALQRASSGLTYPSVPPSTPRASPGFLSPWPGGQETPSALPAIYYKCLTPSDGTSTPPLVAESRNTDLSISQLAPIRGPKPKIALTNKHLDNVRHAPTAANRSPTPPAWDSGPDNDTSQPSDQPTKSSPFNPKPRKKKKKKKALNSPSVNSEDTDELGEEDGVVGGILDSGCIHSGVMLSMDQQQEQRLALDRSIQSLLH